MKVLVITRTLAEFANLQGKFREMASLGVELTVVSPFRWAGQSYEIEKVNACGYELILHCCWFSGTKSIRLGNHLHFYPGISRVIASREWDLIHIDEEPFNFATYHALRECRRYGRPAVFTTWQNLNKNYPPPFNFFERYVFEHSVGGMAGNAEGLELLSKRGFRKKRAQVRHLGVDVQLFCAKDTRLLRRRLGLENVFVVGFVGRMDRQKGLDTLVKAFARFSRRAVLLLLTARGPYWAELENLITELGIAPKVLLLPWVKSSEVPDYMGCLDVLVLPSHTMPNVKEQFGRVLVEAMACEKPVIGSDSGDIPNVIGEAGLVFHEGDVRELSSYLETLMEDSSLRESLGRRGRTRVVEEFSYAKIAKHAVDFYCEVLVGIDSKYEKRKVLPKDEARAALVELSNT